MRIIHIAAGAGSMYCGACARDITLIRGLLAHGHDIQVIPLYTPLKVDGEAPLPLSRIFYSGINVFLQQALALFRITPVVIDKLFEHPALLQWVSNFAIETRADKLGPMTISVLAGKDGHQRKELIKLLDFLAAEVKPELVTITNSLLSGIAPALKERLQVPVVCMLQGEEAFVSAMPEPYCSRARALMQQNARYIDLFLSPGDAYATKMVEYLGVPADRVRVVRAGIDAAAFHTDAPRVTTPFTIGYLSVITPAKGLDLLVDAFSTLVKQGRDVELRVAGRVLNKGYWETIEKRIRDDGLSGRFEFLDEVDLAGKVDFLQRCSVFVLPSRIAESRGMVVMEAMAAGAPVIVPDAGIFPEMLARTGGGVLFPPGDADALAREIARLLDNPQTADQLARQGAMGAAQYYSAERMTEETLFEYERLLAATHTTTVSGT